MATRRMRAVELTSAGMVLPIAWNMLELTNTMPEATKLKEMMRRYSPPTASTWGSCEKTPIIAWGARWQRMVKQAMSTAAKVTPTRNVSRTRSAWRAPKF
jgi:hypothetical protein